MTYGAEIWGPPLIAGAASLFSSMGKQKKETKMQKAQRKLADQLIDSITGQGPFSDLYNPSEEAFQKSFVEPAKTRFANQIAPNIQQQYVASGQQRSSGLDDQLLRAGVDLDSMLNEQYYKFQQDALNRKMDTFKSVLGAGSGAPQETSTLQDLSSGISGVLANPDFQQNLFGSFKNTPDATQQSQKYATPTRRGYAPDWSDWQLGDKRWGAVS